MGSARAAGGALATLCAFDLLAQSAVVRAAGALTLLSFAAPRMFNQAFQDAMSALIADGALHALRVVVGGDVIARIPPKQVGCVHGVKPRLLLHPADQAAPCTYTDADPDDADLWPILPADVHVCHALFLGGESTPAHVLTVPNTFAWPLAPTAPTTPTRSTTPTTPAATCEPSVEVGAAASEGVGGNQAWADHGAAGLTVRKQSPVGLERPGSVQGSVWLLLHMLWVGAAIAWMLCEAFAEI